MKVIRVRHKALVTNYDSELKRKLTLYGEDFNGNKVEIKTYEETPEGLWIPRALVSYPVDNAGWKKVEIAFNGKLRSYQENIVSQWFKKGQGIISAGTGTGKTTMALYIASKLGLKTLVVVHTDTLFKQWIQRVKQYCGFYPEYIRGDYCDTSTPIVIGMLKTLAIGTKIDRNRLYKEFGFTVFDEVHRVPSVFYNTVAGMFWDKHRLGLSATPERRDGMHKIAMWNIGGIVASYYSRAVEPVIYMVRYVDWGITGNLYYKGEFQLARAINAITDSKIRSKMIAGYILKGYKSGRRIMVLSDRLKLLKNIEALLSSAGVKDVGYLTGEEKNIDRQIILATYGAGAEGFDLPELDYLIFATPRADVRQSIGRILRPKEKRPIVIDIVDSTIKEFKLFALKRERYYRKLKYEVKEIIMDRGIADALYERMVFEK